MILPDEVLLVFLLPLAVQVVLVLPHLLPHLVHLEDGHDHDDNGDDDGNDGDEGDKGEDEEEFLPSLLHKSHTQASWSGSSHQDSPCTSGRCR